MKTLTVKLTFKTLEKEFPLDVIVDGIFSMQGCSNNIDFPHTDAVDDFLRQCAEIDPAIVPAIDQWTSAVLCESVGYIFAEGYSHRDQFSLETADYQQVGVINWEVLLDHNPAEYSDIEAEIN
jgi:hypothetical protein